MIAALMWVGRGILAFLSGKWLAQITLEGLKVAAFKLFMGTIIFTVLPVILYNVVIDLVVDFMGWALDYIGASGFAGDGLLIQLTGMGGWLANVLGLPSMFAMLMSAVAIRFVLNIVRL